MLAMPTFPYESLSVYQKTFALNREVYSFLKNKPSIPLYIKNQLGRATLSILLNIAEGSGKFTDKDKRNFYITARGSAYECSALIKFLAAENEIQETLAVMLCEMYQEITKMLFGMVKALEK